MSTARKLYKGEKRYIRTLVRKPEGGDFELSAAAYEVYAPLVANPIDTGSAMIEGREVFFMLDTTDDDYVAGRTYRAYTEIRVVGESKILRHLQNIEIVP